MNPFAAWWLAIRPKTLSLAATPVLVGGSIAWSQLGGLDWPVYGATQAAALLIQIGTNLYNDAADFERGSDGPDRLGPRRAAAQGWLTPGQIKRGAAISFGLAFLLGIYLAVVGGWPIVALGLASLTAGYAYTGGPKPIAYSAGGELFVFLFFGLFAVVGTVYLQTGDLTGDAMAAGSALGLLAAAVLLVNNYRDLEGDRKAGKLTLCHYLGRERARLFYAALVLLPFALALLNTATWPILLATPFGLLLVRRFFRQAPGPELNKVLAATAGQQLLFGLLLCVGYLL